MYKAFTFSKPVHRHVAAVGVLAALLPAAVWADPSAQKDLGKGPIHITADHLYAQNRPTQQAVYTGHVVMTQGDLVVHAARLTIDAVKGKVQQAVATGSPVALTMSSAGRHGYGDRLIYRPGSGKIVLQGDAHLWQKKNEVSGKQVVYFIHSQQTRVSASAGEKVRSIFYPAATAPSPPASAPARS